MQKKKNEEHLTFREILLPSSKIKEQKIPPREKRPFIFDEGRKISRNVNWFSFLFSVNKFNCL